MRTRGAGPARSEAAAIRVAPQPFLKWVGGKAQLLAQFAPFFSAEIERYVEPFLGGGAVFFHLKDRSPAMPTLLRDNNDELINCYRAVRDCPAALMRGLDEHWAGYRAGGGDYYYAVRGRHALPAVARVARAARMIFLNKTCFNGLFRVNSRGHFNVPVGSPRTTAFYDRGALLAASAALRGVELATQDFRTTLAEARRGDFVYIDPPYVPVSATARFTSYTKEDFGAREQADLAAAATAAAQRGARVMVSNSETPWVRELYRDFAVHPVRARRAINRDGAKRGAVGEIVACAGGSPGSGGRRAATGGG